jgi:16S rRNA (adenine1518-N6/adenine1519-N6)-dimethyltransferase
LKNVPQFKDLPPLREVIAAHGLRAEKALGQNFLLDQNLTDKIVRLTNSAGGDLSGLHVFEIGPGPGGLTRSLLQSQAQSVTAIEFDPRAVAALQDLQARAPERLAIMQGDALKADLTALKPAPRAIIANLPYNIATPLLLGWLRQIRQNPGNFTLMALMFQKEVGDRILAPPGTKTYGRLSVITQWLCDVRRIMDLPPSAFTPPPKVRSSVLLFKPKLLQNDAPQFEAIEAITAEAFNQRRKMIRSSMKSYAAVIAQLGIDDARRAETLSVEEFVAIAKTAPLKNRS